MDSSKWKIVKSNFLELIDLPTEERVRRLQDCDPDIRNEIEELFDAHENAGGFIASPIMIEQGLADDETKDYLVGELIGNYRVLERIGTGGMGAVYLVERINSDFTQKAALKIIKRGMDSETILKRFANERKILSTLKHPNIAQLLDGGISKEGAPFFVMEFVAGKPLTRFCSEKDLTLERRLNVFLQICSAVEYAHRNLVIHRDLKPSNILVTTDETPKLLDFGIAKLLSDGEGEATATQAKMFTPEYASPEQILGKDVTTSSDVYSLGVILYELLSGYRPFETKGKSYAEIVKNVCEDEPTKPSLRATAYKGVETKDEGEGRLVRIGNPKSLQGDLDNIILKAINKEPSERYGSVQQFSDDVSRFLKGLPVTARPQTYRYRFGKYIRRHKLGVLAAAVVLFSLFGGTSVAIWQAQVARSERERAEQNFNDVRGLAKSVIFDLHKAIRDLPGSTAARELLVTKSLEYLDKLALQNQKDLALQAELADGYDEIGNIQGGFLGNHLGQREKALESYQKALAIREKLIAVDPQNIQFRKGLGASYFKIGGVYYVQAKVQDSLAMYGNSVEIFEELLRETPADTGCKSWLAKGLKQLSLVSAVSGKVDEGFAAIERSVQLTGEVANEDPNVDNLHSLASSINAQAGFMIQLKKDYGAALGLYERSFEIAKQISATEPDNTIYQRDVAVSYDNFGELYFRKEDYESALTNKRLAREMFVRLRDQDPQNEEMRTIVSKVERWISRILIKMGKPAEAIPNLNKSLEILEKQYAGSPADKEVYFEMGEVYLQLGYAYKSIDRKKSCGYLLKTYRVYQEFINAGYTDDGFDEKELNRLRAEAGQCDK